MTDLLSVEQNTPTNVDGQADDAAADDANRRTFRAATLDEAVEAARAELGPDVELIEAHRVRRGGLGGFFATDLGVEIVAASGSSAATAPAAAAHTANAPTASTDFAAALDRASANVPLVDPDPEPTTGLDRLIRHAEAQDRVIPMEHADRLGDFPATEPPAADQDASNWLDSVMADTMARDTETREMPVSDPSSTDMVFPEWTFPTEDDDADADLHAGLDAELHADPDPDPDADLQAALGVEPEATRAASTAGADVDADAATWLDELMSKTISEELDEWPSSHTDEDITRPHGLPAVSTALDVPAERQQPVAMTAADGEQIAERLVQSLWSVGHQTKQPLRGVTVSITLEGGTTVNVAADFSAEVY